MEKVVDTVLGTPYWSGLPSRFGDRPVRQVQAGAGSRPRRRRQARLHRPVLPPGGPDRPAETGRGPFPVPRPVPDQRGGHAARPGDGPMGRAGEPAGPRRHTHPSATGRHRPRAVRVRREPRVQPVARLAGARAGREHRGGPQGGLPGVGGRPAELQRHPARGADRAAAGGVETRRPVPAGKGCQGRPGGDSPGDRRGPRRKQPRLASSSARR